MPIYLLGARTARVEIPNQPLAVSISGSVSGAALYVEPSANVVRVNAHLAVLPAMSGPVTIGVEPVGAPTFGHGTVVHLSIGPDNQSDLDPVQIGFDPVDVSGAGAMELAALTPAGPRVEVAVRAVADSPLGPLAAMARTAARRAGGARQRPRSGSLTIAVDTSASMLPAFTDGSVAAAVDVIVGVADVAGIGDVDVLLVGSRTAAVRAPAAELAAAVAGTQVRWSAGARWSALPSGVRTIAVTDARDVPVGRLPVLRITGDPRCAQLGPVLVPPPSGAAADRALAEDPAALDRLAAGLLAVLT